jgi:hypothetical protein
MFSVTIPEYEQKVINNLIDNDTEKYVVNKPGDTDMTTMIDELVTFPFKQIFYMEQKELFAAESIERIQNMITY